MNIKKFTVGFLFCGLGAGALGFLEAVSRLGVHSAHFRAVGGIDNDKEACADFEMLTGSKSKLADVSQMQPAELKAEWGDEAPDCVFLSPPCKGFSGLLSKKQSATEKYQDLNKLVLQGLFLVCETWETPPSLLVLENVPGIRSRGALLLSQVRQLLANYGYIFHEATHDCGEIGNLAQHRRRYLLVARLPAKVPCFVYQPPKRKVRACGEVLGLLPLPEDPSAGKLHALPKLSWLNWVRLALIPAGGDWRDLPKQEPTSLQKTGENADSFGGRPGLYGVGDWEKPVPTVTGHMSISSGNGQAAIADPRPYGFKNNYGVAEWDQPIGTITGNAKTSSGTFSVADSRIALPDNNPNRHQNKYKVTDWNKPAGTVIGACQVGSGAPSVADPRVALSCKPPSGS